MKRRKEWKGRRKRRLGKLGGRREERTGGMKED
jgi:hypothetical protein